VTIHGGMSSGLALQHHSKRQLSIPGAFLIGRRRECWQWEFLAADIGTVSQLYAQPLQPLFTGVMRALD